MGKEEILIALSNTLSSRTDLSWARVRLQQSTDGTVSSARVSVMPKPRWWSELERAYLKEDLQDVISCYLFLEDERLYGPEMADYLKEAELLIDNDPMTRVAEDLRRTETRINLDEAVRSSEDTNHLANVYASQAVVECRTQRFDPFLSIKYELQTRTGRLGDEERIRLSHTAELAGREALALCCDALHLVQGGASMPHSIHAAFYDLAGRQLLPFDTARRLAVWVAHAIMREEFFSAFETKSSTTQRNDAALLDIERDDLLKLPALVVRLANARINKPEEQPPSAPFEADAVLLRLKELAEEYRSGPEREILQIVRNQITIRKFFGIKKDHSASPSWWLDTRPFARCLVLTYRPLKPEFTHRLAEAIYGNASRLYKADFVLRKSRTTDAQEALLGRPPEYKPLDMPSIPDFIRSGGGVVVLDGAQNVEESVFSLLADVADGYLCQPGWERSYVGDICLVVAGTFEVGSPAELAAAAIEAGQQLPPADDWNTDIPRSFELAVELDAARRSPELLSARNISRFDDLCVGSLWSLFQRRTAEGRREEPLVTAVHIPRPSSAIKKNSLAAMKNSVRDIRSLTDIQPETGKFDVFVSYSWVRTAHAAHAVVEALRDRYRVYLDREQLPLNAAMSFYVPALIRAVRSSRVVLIFAIQLDAPYIPASNEEAEEALREGWAIRLPDSEVLALWSWQTLENISATYKLIVHENCANASFLEGADWEFPDRQYHTFDELLAIIEDYIQYRLGTS